MQVLHTLPKYKFKETKAYCPHGVPDCLCDVVIDKPVALGRDGVMFSKIAFDQMRVDTVTANNLYEFMSLVLGCHELYIETFETNVVECEVCGNNVPTVNIRTRTTCSQVCRNKKSRMRKKELANALR